MSNTKRLEHIDIAKGICMLLIMLGHCATGTPERHSIFLITWIYSFHTTTFFVITGMLMAHIKEYDRPFKQVMFVNAKRLLLPYFGFQCLYMVWFCIRNGMNNALWMFREIFLLVDWDYASWFLLVLFVSKTIVILIHKLCKDTKVTNIILMAVFFIGLVLTKSNKEFAFAWLFRQMIRSLIGIGFIEIGIVLYPFDKYIDGKTVIFLSLVMSLLTAYLNGIVSTFNLRISNPILYTISAVFGAIFTISISKVMKSRFFSFYGKESILALGLHQVILRSFPFKSIFLWFVITPLTTIGMYLFVILKRITQS